MSPETYNIVISLKQTYSQWTPLSKLDYLYIRAKQPFIARFMVCNHFHQNIFLVNSTSLGCIVDNWVVAVPFEEGGELGIIFNDTVLLYIRQPCYLLTMNIL